MGMAPALRSYIVRYWLLHSSKEYPRRATEVGRRDIFPGSPSFFGVNKDLKDDKRAEIIPEGKGQYDLLGQEDSITIYQTQG